MKINTDSWHYRLTNWDFLGSVTPNNLCLYFWAVVYKIVGMLVFSAMVLSVVVALYMFLFVIFSYVIWPVILASSTYVIIGVGVVSALIIWKANKVIKNAPEGSAVAVTTEYVKAKKQRICPRIEFD